MEQGREQWKERGVVFVASRPGFLLCEEVPRCFHAAPSAGLAAGVDFNSHLPNYTFKRCQISKTSPPSQSKHLGEKRSRRG